MQYGYRDRKRKKRTFRALWIQRINAAVREHGLTYGRFINGLEQGRASRSTARCWPTSPSRTQLASRRSCDQAAAQAEEGGAKSSSRNFAQRHIRDPRTRSVTAVAGFRLSASCRRLLPACALRPG